MTDPVLTSLLPVVLLIAVGFLAGRRGWVRAGSLKDLSNLIFVVLTPALLFRTMAGVRVQDLDLSPLGSYFGAAGLIFGVVLAVSRFSRRGAVLGLAATFSNTVMIGIPLVGLAYGQAGLVQLLTLISVHSLLMLTLATVVLEVAVQREAQQPLLRADGAVRASLRAPVLRALRNAIIHPVPLPILAGLVFAQTGWVLPAVLDRPLQWMGNAFGPLALILVGVTLAFAPVGAHWRGAVGIALVKNLVHPALVLALGLLLGQGGVPLAVMVVTASLPVGANVFLFSQRYDVAQDLVTSSVAVSAVLALLTVGGVLMLAQRMLA